MEREPLRSPHANCIGEACQLAPIARQVLNEMNTTTL